MVDARTRASRNRMLKLVGRCGGVTSTSALTMAVVAFSVTAYAAQDAQTTQATAVTVSCTSTPGERQQCVADTSAGIALVRSTGSAACLLGKTWGYDNGAVWVSDGCSGEFILGQANATGEKAAEEEKAPEYIPNVGFLLYDGEKGQIYFRLFSYARYINQLSVDGTFTDAFGIERSVKRRQDMQLNKFFSPFSGWFLTPKFRYYLYVWS